MSNDLILGTAGHIDHGKTTLIRALTGTNTDRLPEEKRRGITIELGFAELVLGDFRMGIVDVPGHEKFVRNMLAGATGIDLALLVIAADDSIKPQTREHLEILRLLNLQHGMIALTKCDLVEEDWLDLIEEEIRDFVSDTFLAQAPIIRTSAETGQGVEEIRNQLLQAATRIDLQERQAGPFRMAIDRTFTMAGHGTVVTGSITSGTTSVGDELVIEPGHVQVRVRGIQNHDRTVESAHRGQRAAINLAGIHHDQTNRGQELCSEGFLHPSRLMTVQCSLLPTAPPLKDRARLRVHLGTAELIATARLLGGDRIEGGQQGFVQLYLNQPAVATWRQPFVIRQESPVTTIGGGHVLVPEANKIRRATEEHSRLLEQLLSDDPLARASAALYFHGVRPWRADDLARMAGVENPTDVSQKLLEDGTLVSLTLSPTRTIVLHQQLLSEIAERLLTKLGKLHDAEPLRTSFGLPALLKSFEYVGDPAIVKYVVKMLQKEKRVNFNERGVGLADRGPKLSQNERKVQQQLIERYKQDGLSPSTVKQYQEKTTKNQASVPQLIQLAAADGQLVEINDELYFHADVEQDIRGKLLDQMADGSGRTLSEIREILNTTRKYAIPLCEYYDRIGFTARDGDLRHLSPQDSR